MFQKMTDLLTTQSGFFIDLFLTHLRLSAIAVMIAGVLGLLIGMMISKNDKIATPVLAVVNILYTFPSIAILGILVSFTGVGDTTAIIALVLYAMLPMVRNTYVGIKNVDKNIVEAAKAMGSTESEMMTKVKLPLAFPVIMSGIRSMVTMTIALGGIASFIGAGGLGVSIYRGITTNNPAMIMTGSLLVALLALGCDLLLGWFEKYAIKKRKIGAPAKVIFGLIALITFTSTIYPHLLPQNQRIKIATKPNTESYILGEMLAALIRQDTELKVEITHGIGGGTNNIHPAMVKGEFDLYPEYTGTSWNLVLKREEFYDEERFDEMNRLYDENFGLTWRGLYGFNNTYGIAVRADLAKKYNLKTYSDLVKVSSNLTFGANYDYFERPDGFPKLKERYDFSFKELMDMDIGLKYKAIREKKVDVITIFTTDGQLAISDIVVLEDDRHFYPSYMAGSVVRTKVLADHPQLGVTLDKMSRILDEQTMAKLNNSVETEGKKPEDVAVKYLKEIGLLEGE